MFATQIIKIILTVNLKFLEVGLTKKYLIF